MSNTKILKRKLLPGGKVKCTCGKQVLRLDNGTIAQHTATVRKTTRIGQRALTRGESLTRHCYGSGVRVTLLSIAG